MRGSSYAALSYLSLLLAAQPLLLAAQPAAQMPDDLVWGKFESWVSSLTPVPPGTSKDVIETFVSFLESEGVPREEAARRGRRVNSHRRGHPDRERFYWDALFKLGGGPSAPLRLLQEAILKTKPGRSLDAGMGSGRNSIYRASNGWEAHGYDLSPEAVKATQRAAERAKVKITAITAGHDGFQFGENQWDLILCSYCYMDSEDPKWPAVFERALRPNGLVVFTGAGRPWSEQGRSAAQEKSLDWRKISDNWSKFHILRLEDLDPGYVGDE
jgi:SAM-dependent methyltransferase